MAVQYVWCARTIDAAICRDRDTSDGSGGDPDGDCTDSDDEHLYYTQDANFNTTALVDASDGSVVERYVYDPYGTVTIWNEARTSTIAWANSKQNEILFCGYRFDPESGLYHVRRRVYHPTLGRWLQRDPLGYVDGMSVYEYCGGTATLTLDPMGLFDANDPRQQLQLRAGMYKGHQRNAQGGRARAQAYERKAQELEAQARRFADEKKRRLLGEAALLREKAEALRGNAAEHEEFMKQIDAEARAILEGLAWERGFQGAGAGNAGGGGDDTPWWDKPYYEGYLYEGYGASDYAREFGRGMDNWGAFEPGAATIANAFTFGYSDDIRRWNAEAWGAHPGEGTWVQSGTEIAAGVAAGAAYSATGAVATEVVSGYGVASLSLTQVGSLAGGEIAAAAAWTYEPLETMVLAGIYFSATDYRVQDFGTGVITGAIEGFTNQSAGPPGSGFFEMGRSIGNLGGTAAGAFSP